MQPTPHDDVNKVLDTLAKGLTRILGKNLIGLYLTGSLTYGDFDHNSSDIDFLTVMDNTLSEKQLQGVEKLHKDIGDRYPLWKKRIEGSYITKKMLTNREPPKESRIYINAGKIWTLVYGNEWLINLHALYTSGITLAGSDIKNLIKPVDINAVRAASKNNLLGEWQPKLNDPFQFNEPDYDSNHLQAYAILTMCRILYTEFQDQIVSKKVASAWVKKTYGHPWDKLIEKAENWKHGMEMNSERKTKAFIQFVIDKVHT